jgi:hypothetical protein
MAAVATDAAWVHSQVSWATYPAGAQGKAIMGGVQGSSPVLGIDMACVYG